MSTLEQQPIEIRGGNHSRETGTLDVTNYDSKDRLVRASKTLALFWALAVASIPIIIAHWVLVPGFLIAGPIMAYRKYNTMRATGAANGTCPSCHDAITIALEADDTLPKRTYCPKCNGPLELVTETK